MNKCPKIGDRVRFPGNYATGPCTGTVTKIYKKHRYADDFDWGGDEIPKPLGLLPEKDWSVSVKVDELPARWPYVGNDCFAPTVGALTKID